MRIVLVLPSLFCLSFSAHPHMLVGLRQKHTFTYFLILIRWPFHLRALNQGRVPAGGNGTITKPAKCINSPAMPTMIFLILTFGDVHCPLQAKVTILKKRGMECWHGTSRCCWAPQPWTLFTCHYSRLFQLTFGFALRVPDQFGHLRQSLVSGANIILHIQAPPRASSCVPGGSQTSVLIKSWSI
jgi:hypothetical protein